jgi:hypothetical protein
MNNLVYCIYRHTCWESLVSCKMLSLSSTNWDEVKLMYSLLSVGKIMIEWWLWRVYLIIKEI